MRYLNTKKKQAYWRELGIVSIIFFILFLYIFLPKLIISGASVVGRISAPIFSLLGRRDMNNSWTLLFSQKKSLLEENRLLAERLSLFESRALLTNLLLEENKTLRGLKANEITTSSNTKLLASVIARGGLSVYGSIIIGLGTEDGAKKGDFVLSESGYLLGAITRADGHTALVTLFSADGLSRDVFVGPNDTLLQAKGLGSDNFIIEAPHEAGIIIGDTVINAEGAPYPLGVVERIKSNPADPFETIRFQHPVNVRDLHSVLIVPSL